MAPVVGRIRRRSSFRALARPDGRAAHGPVTVLYSQVDEAIGAPLVAYAVGRRVGPAVVRNRLRRRLRACVHSAARALPPGAYLVRAEPPATHLAFEELDEAVRTAFGVAARRSGVRA